MGHVKYRVSGKVHVVQGLGRSDRSPVPSPVDQRTKGLGSFPVRKAGVQIRTLEVRR